MAVDPLQGAQRPLGRRRDRADTVPSQMSKVLPVGNPAALRRARIEDAWRPASSSVSSALSLLRPVPSVVPWRWPTGPVLRRACEVGAGRGASRRPRRSALSSSVASEATPSGGAGLQRVHVIGAPALSGRVGEPGSRPGRRLRSGRTSRRGRAPNQRRICAVEAGKGDGFGHLDLHPARARGGCFNEPGAGAVSDGEELGLGRARRLRTPSPAAQPGVAGSGRRRSSDAQVSNAGGGQPRLGLTVRSG